MWESVHQQLCVPFFNNKAKAAVVLGEVSHEPTLSRGCDPSVEWLPSLLRTNAEAKEKSYAGEE